MKLRTQILGFITVATVTRIFFEPNQNNCFIVLHSLTKKRSDEQLRMIREHNLFLDTSWAQSPSSYKGICEIYFQATEIILNAFVISSHLQFTHVIISSFFYQILKAISRRYSRDCESLFVVSRFFDLSLYVLYYCLSFILIMRKDKGKIDLVCKVFILLFMVFLFWD